MYNYFEGSDNSSGQVTRWRPPRSNTDLPCIYLKTTLQKSGYSFSN